MARFGFTLVHHPEGQRLGKLARFYLRVFGNHFTGSSHVDFQKIAKSRIKSGSVLDAGCGKGVYAFWLAKQFPNVRIDGIDLSAENISVCNKIKQRIDIHNVNFHLGNLVDFRRPNYYQFIYSSHVLEHIKENRQVIENLYHSLIKGGELYLRIPSKIQSRLLNKKYCRAHDEWAKQEHIGQHFTYETLVDTLKEATFLILYSKITDGFWGKLSFELKEMILTYYNNRALFAIIMPILKLFGRLDSMWTYKEGNGIMVLAQKPI